MLYIFPVFLNLIQLSKIDLAVGARSKIIPENVIHVNIRAGFLVEKLFTGTIKTLYAQNIKKSQLNPKTIFSVYIVYMNKSYRSNLIEHLCFYFFCSFFPLYILKVVVLNYDEKCVV